MPKPTRRPRIDPETSRQSVEALEEAIKKCDDSQAELARRITGERTPPIKQQHVWNWLNRDKVVPPEVVIDIERETGVSRHRLRRDVYPVEQALSA